jgi:single-strand DNA-binding protein
MNEIQVTLRGNVATEPRHVRFDDGSTLTSFRLASTARRYDWERREWVDRGTTFVNVICRRAMANNAASSVRKGQPLLVTGRLTERHWSSNERTGHTLEIQAVGLGHDLSFGTSQFSRIVQAERVRPPIDVSGLSEAELDEGTGSAGETSSDEEAGREGRLRLGAATRLGDGLRLGPDEDDRLDEDTGLDEDEGLDEGVASLVGQDGRS